MISLGIAGVVENTALTQLLAGFSKEEDLVKNEWARIQAEYPTSDGSKGADLELYVPTKKKLQIASFPNVLTLYLKRFDNTGNKTVTKIDAPLTLQIPSASAKKGLGTSPNYHLVVFSVHIGTTITGGHFVAYVKRVQKDGTVKWYYCSDTAVQEKLATEAKNNAQDGYVYVYV